MAQSLVRLAANEFTQGNYLVALDLYRKLSRQLGDNLFRVNICLCEKKLRNKGRRDCAQLHLKSIKVACVMDEFTFQCVDPECQLMPLTPENVLEELGQFNPDLLFIESAWRGKDELWNRKIGTLSKELRTALQWCKERQVPTIFWNKEDPIHFETFLTTAQQFDYVFTTDIDCIARYKAALKHDRVFLLPFACQPKVHNPVELYARKDAFCFAGAYYVRYPERTRDLENYVSEFNKYKPLEIYDRNFGKEDVNYQFPGEYQPYIVGTLPFNEIDKAYKGYRFAINLNSIKQSQTMFARRVYELLGSNTVTVSNFSRGVRLLFGDLVVSSDSGQEIVQRLQQMDEETSLKFRLAGLRKVMLEHTYEHRLAYVVRKALGWRGEDGLLGMVVIAIVASEEELLRAVENYRRQRYARKRLFIIIQNGIAVEQLNFDDKTINVINIEDVSELPISNVINSQDWITIFSPNDYYGPNYLVDLALASRYSSHQVVGKAARFQWTEQGVQLVDTHLAYQTDVRLSVHASAIRADLLDHSQAILAWLKQLGNFFEQSGQAIDAFNYCENAYRAKDFSDVAARVDDMQIDAGLSLDDIIKVAEVIPPAESDETGLPRWNGAKFAQLFGQIKHQLVQFEAKNSGLSIRSDLPDGKHEYFYAKQDLPISALSVRNVLETHLDATPGLDVQYVFIFLDDKKQKISHVIHTANRNHTVSIPEGTSFVRFGWRVYGSGLTTIGALILGHRKLEPPVILGSSDTLLLTNHYPSYDELYRNGFVHSRVKGYLNRGVKVDVFRLHPGKVTSYHEFQNIDVVTGDQAALRKMLDSGRYRSVLVHFLSPHMWDVLKCYQGLRIFVWVHGAEIQPFHRREYNYQSDATRVRAMLESEQRMNFWRGLLKPKPENLKLVFVSRYFAEEVMEDLGFSLPDDSYAIIHNPIDTKLFSFIPKPIEQRKKVLSIRPYASQKYANDLSVQAILRLSDFPFFSELEFRMIGDGKMFDEILKPLKIFPNIIIERKFLTQQEIATLHKDYGVFLTPTRMDAQGVSRDEAMASGLVPITNAVAAIPEFVDEDCAFLAPPEDANGLALAIKRLYSDPELFQSMSKSAVNRIRRQTSCDILIKKELSFFGEFDD